MTTFTNYCLDCWGVCLCVWVSGQIRGMRDSSLAGHCFSQTALERKTFTNSPGEKMVYKLKLTQGSALLPPQPQETSIPAPLVNHSFWELHLEEQESRSSGRIDRFNPFCWDHCPSAFICQKKGKKKKKGTIRNTASCHGSTLLYSTVQWCNIWPKRCRSTFNSLI